MMNFKKLITVSFISFLLLGCQTIKEKSDAIAEKTASELEDYPNQAESHFRDIKEILIKEGSDFKN